MYANSTSYLTFQTQTIEKPNISLKPSLNFNSLFFITVVGPVYEGLSNLKSKLFSIVKNHPTEVISVTGALITNHTDVVNTVPYLPVICALPTTYKTLKMFLQIIASSNAKTLTKAVLATGIIYIGVQAPAAAALQWWSISSFRSHYSGRNGCIPEALKQWKDIKYCLDNPSSTKCAQIADTSFNHQIFARKNDAISITFKGNEKICVISSTGEAAATRLCFDPKNPHQHTVEAVPLEMLTDNMADLEDGERKMALGIELCGGVKTLPPQTIPETMTCIFTQLSSQDSTTKTCFDPHHPMDSVIVEKAPDVDLGISTAPASFVMKNVKSSNDQKSCSCEI